MRKPIPIKYSFYLYLNKIVSNSIIENIIIMLYDIKRVRVAILNTI